MSHLAIIGIFVALGGMPGAAQPLPMDKRYQELGYEKALAEARANLKKAEQQQSAEQRIPWLTAIGRLHWNAKKLDESWSSYELAWRVAVRNQIGGAMGVVWSRLVEFPDAIPKRIEGLLDRTVLQLPRGPARRAAPGMLSVLARNQRNLAASKVLFETALKVIQAAEAGRVANQILLAYGERCLLRGELACAAAKLTESAELSRRVGLPLREADAYIRLSRVHAQHQQYDKAIEFERQAQAINEKAGRHELAIACRMKVAYYLAEAGNRKRSIEEYESGIAAARASGISQLKLFLTAYASAVADAGDLARASALLRQAEAAPDKESRKALRGMLESQLAVAYWKVGEFENAIQHADLALVASAQTGHVQAKMEALRARALAQRAKGNVDAAISDIKELLRLLGDLARTLVPDDFMKRGFFEHRAKTVTLGVELLESRGRHREALETAEFARARAFIDLLASRRGESADFEDLREALETPAESLPSDLSVAALSADEMIAVARKIKSTILTFYVTPAVTYMWSITPSGQIAAAMRSVKEEQLKGLAARARSRKDKPDQAALRELHRLLIDPLRHTFRPPARLAVIPHGPLFDIPFAALLDEKGRYLVEDHQLHYAYASGVFSYLDKAGSRAAAARPSYLLVAAPERLGTAGGKPLAPLPAARIEIDEIRRAVAPADIQSLVGAQARKETVVVALNGKQVLHFATHAILDPREPLQSYLALSDGAKLTAAEINKLQLSAELVVLSACQSATGAVSADGVLGLTRAFFSSGARRVLASVWDVGDGPSARLVADFHREYRWGGDIAGALRTAQLRMLQALRAGEVAVDTPAGKVALPEHPALWGGFVLHGPP